jgi:dolichol-phosphate mannosyltransferase
MAVPTVPDLTIVIPTYNERENVRPLVARLDAALQGLRWEAVFVDDDSGDGTAREVRAVAREDGRVRVLHRIGRRGLSGACIEGILSSVAPICAVMDADLQHDEAILPQMFAALRDDPGLSLVIGSRNVEGGSSGDGLTRGRQVGSDMATGLAKRLLKIEASDPMSGFFMVRREAFNEVVLDLQSAGFKILADMLAAARGRWKVAEIGYTFRERHAGDSKMDSAVVLEFLGLILSRMTGGMVSIRFVLFLMVGASGVLVQLGAVWLALLALPGQFPLAQVIGVATAMTTNFVLNNLLTYRDRSLRGAAFFRGLLSFYAVCSVGAIANVGVATAVYAALPWWAFASFLGALTGAVWNFVASAIFTWKAR